MNLNKTGVAVLLVSVGILSACGDNADQSSDDMTTSGSEQRDTDETGSDEGLTEKEIQILERIPTRLILILERVQLKTKLIYR